MVPQARAHPAAAVRAVRRPGHRRGHLPGHQDLAHAADRQRRAHGRGGRPGARDDLRPGRARASRAGTWPTRGWPRCTGRPGTARCPRPRVSVAGESALWVDPAEIPSDGDIGKLGRALAAGRHGERDELMASTAAYSGLRWGELTALTIGQVDQAARVITVDRKVIEVAGHLYVEAPKNRKYRKTIYPRRTPGRLPARREARRPHRAGPRRAGSRHQPARADLPLADGQALAVLQLQPQRPQARLPGRRLARRGRQRQVDLAQPAARVLHHRPVHLEARPHRRVPHGRARQRTASPSTCTSAPPPASSTAPARPPTNPCPSAMRDRARLAQAVACPVPPRRHGGTA